MDQFFNHHNVDQFPQLDELPPQDLALDSFRMLYPLPATSAHVNADGKRMFYKLTGSRLMENYMSMARLLIATHRLPLIVDRDRFAYGDVVFHDHMVIIYVPKTR